LRAGEHAFLGLPITFPFVQGLTLSSPTTCRGGNKFSLPFYGGVCPEVIEGPVLSEIEVVRMGFYQREIQYLQQ